MVILANAFSDLAGLSRCRLDSLIVVVHFDFYEVVREVKRTKPNATRALQASRI